MRIAEIVVLVRPEINAEAGADDGPPLQGLRRPSKPEPGSEVVPIGRIHRCSGRTETVAAQHVDDGDAVLHLADNGVVFISKTQVQSQIGTELKLVLPITHPQGAPHAADAQCSVDPDRVDDVVQVIVEAAVRYGGVVDRIAGIIQADAADVFTQLESVPSANEGEVIDDGEGGAHFDI